MNPSGITKTLTSSSFVSSTSTHYNTKSTFGAPIRNAKGRNLTFWILLSSQEVTRILRTSFTAVISSGAEVKIEPKRWNSPVYQILVIFPFHHRPPESNLFSRWPLCAELLNSPENILKIRVRRRLLSWLHFELYPRHVPSLGSSIESSCPNCSTTAAAGR